MQRGEIKRIGRTWYLRFYRDELQEGQLVRRRVWRKLARYGDSYRSAKDLRPLAAKILGSVDSDRLEAEAGMLLSAFVEEIYFPHIEFRLRPSTVKGYRDIWKNHFSGRLNSFRVYEFRTIDGQRLLDEITKARADLSHKSMLRVKAFLSGVFTIAKQKGAYDGANPMEGVKAEGKVRRFEGSAYTLEEIQRMVKKLDEPARTVVLTAALSGLRESELRGLRWEDCRDGVLQVQRSVWRTHVSQQLKTAESADAVPVIPLLRDTLVAHRKRMPTAQFVFEGEKGRPLNLDNLSRRVIHPAVGSLWRGWHGFRRGLATNLARLGVRDKVIQGILRHANVATTQASYIIVDRADATQAMKKFSHAVGKIGIRLGQARRISL